LRGVTKKHVFVVCVKDTTKNPGAKKTERKYANNSANGEPPILTQRMSIRKDGGEKTPIK
jgi:hypothetical protein